VTAEEEFGIAAVEALASGRPVIAVRSGGVLETVVDGVTGTFYEPGDSPKALAEAIRRFDPGSVDARVCVSEAQRYGIPRFQERLRAIVGETIAAERIPRVMDRQLAGLIPLRGVKRDAQLMRIR
jgi:glycosyltransferase involved in cell wall biosynthesis